MMIEKPTRLHTVCSAAKTLAYMCKYTDHCPKFYFLHTTWEESSWFAAFFKATFGIEGVKDCPADLPADLPACVCECSSSSSSDFYKGWQRILLDNTAVKMQPKTQLKSEAKND